MVEVFFVQIGVDRVRWNRVSKELLSNEQTVSVPTPDALVDEIVQSCNGNKHSCTHRYLSHSTSWRFQSPATLVLSYIVYPYEAEQYEQPSWYELRLPDLQLAHCHTASQPSPSEIEHLHVLSHGLRHLALLTQGITMDKTVSNSLPSHAKHFLSKVMPALAGQLPS